tara:strand:- start:2277 stop:2459 length:183 start_codon:yes stop_codon:yes gene_type:complete
MGRALNKIEYSQRIDGKWNKWQTWSAANWYDWDFEEVEHLLEHMDYMKWILVDVVERKGQ